MSLANGVEVVLSSRFVNCDAFWVFFLELVLVVISLSSTALFCYNNSTLFSFRVFTSSIHIVNFS